MFRSGRKFVFTTPSMLGYPALACPRYPTILEHTGEPRWRVVSRNTETCVSPGPPSPTVGCFRQIVACLRDSHISMMPPQPGEQASLPSVLARYLDPDNIKSSKQEGRTRTWPSVVGYTANAPLGAQRAELDHVLCDALSKPGVPSHDRLSAPGRPLGPVQKSLPHHLSRTVVVAIECGDIVSGL